MRAIVLAAGTGSRLGQITQARTKGMVPVCGRRLIDHLFKFLDLSFFDEIIVVGGFYYEDLKKHVDQLGFRKIKVVENKDYLKGNIFTLMRALEEFRTDSFLITNVDHIYPRVMFEKMKNSFKGITSMCDFDRDLGADDMKVKLKDGGKKISMIDKKLTDFDCGYIGMTFVDGSILPAYKAAISKALKLFGDKAVVENVLKILSEDPANSPSICDLSGFGWYEVDNEEDLKKAEEGLRKNKGKFGI
jgi:choline kinase